LKLFLFESVDEFDGGEEPDALAMVLDGLDADRRSEMGLACAGTADRDDIVGVFQELAAMELACERFVELSFDFMTGFGLHPSYMGIFRVSLCSMAFYTSAMFCFSFLLHLDLRRPALLIVLTFLVLNGTLTVALLPLGPDFYGYGNMISATVTLLLGFYLVLRELSWLHYHAFITNNPCV
jgi:polysaccharide biosynthesis protein PelG